jgi:hypothetical protein
MAVNIFNHSDTKIYVNDKLVERDMNGNWIAKIELTTNEMQAFREHVDSRSPEDVTDDKKP